MTDNSILIENQKPGTPQSVWDAPATNQIEGFATDISTNHGGTVNFKINLNVGQGQTAPYHIEIYRLGYYGGAGATLVTTLSNLHGGAQPNPVTDSRGVVDAGNWAVSASWATPSTAVSGVYLAKLVRDDEPNATNQIPFIIRDDGSTSDIVLQTDDTTWQAYNGWAGNNAKVGGSLYGGYSQPPGLAADPAPLDYNRAFAVSYNRPIITRDGGGQYAGPQDYLFGATYSAVYWLEKNGYSVSYISGVDTDRLGASNLEQHKAYISVGHDEYWSGDQRANVEAARDAGVNLLFWSGNEVYWKTRWENSIVDGQSDRTLVSYKETKFNYSLDAKAQDYANVDPSNQWTGTWRDTRFVNAVAADGVTHTAIGARPENALTGQMMVGDGNGQFGGAIDVPAAMATLREWRNTGVGANGANDIAPGIIGYEWDTSPNDANRPAGLIKLSDTLVSWGDIVTDQGNRESAGSADHTLTLYRAPSGALVFGAGTVFWSWGLSNQHDSGPYSANIASTALQQFTANLFADMGIQPAVTDAFLQSEGLVRASASPDHDAANALLNTLPDTVNLFANTTISGSANDVSNDPGNVDGKVAIVEVSVDGGQTWALAQGASSWSFNWTPTQAGTYTIEARAIDDSLNLPSGGRIATKVVTAILAPPPSGFSLFSAQQSPAGTVFNDGKGVELGMKFSVAGAGTITALSYYRAASDAIDTDTREGHLWSSSGTLLGTVTFTSTPGQSGWQIATLSTPVAVQAGQTYVVSYHTTDNYLATAGYFSSAVSDPFGELTAPADAASGGNGVYAYGSGALYPSQTFGAANYWTDVVFSPATASPQVGFTTTTLSLAEGNSGVTAFSYTLTRTGDTSGASSVAWSVGGSGANPADAADFQGGVLPTGVASFAAGETSKIITVNVAGDANLEPDEGFTVTLSAGAGATLGTATATGTIVNDDSAPVTQIGLTTPTLSLAEGNSGATAFSYTLTRSGDTSGASSVNWAVTGSGANPANAADFQGGVLPTGVANFAAGETSKTIIVNVAGDTTFEPDEGFTVSLSAPTGAALGAATAAGTILNDDSAPAQMGFTTTALSLAEGNGGATAFAYTLTRSGDTSGASSVNWSVTGSGANPANAADFQGGVLPSGVASFAAGETSKVINVNVAGDTSFEPDEGFTVTLSGATGGAIGAATAAGTILNDDVDPAASLFGSTAATGTVYNDGKGVELGMKFSATAAGTITALRYFRAAADASDTDTRAGHLWSSTGTLLGTVTFTSAPGQSGWQVATLATPVAIQPGQTYVVSYHTADNYLAAGNYFTAGVTDPSGELTAPSSAASGGNGVYAYSSAALFPNQSFAAANYWADVVFSPSTPSPQIALSTASLSLAEGGSGATAFAYTLTRTGDASGASSVNWAVAGSGANPADANDFLGAVLPSGTVNFAAGETSKVITVNVAGDTTFEPDEGFTLTLSGVNGATLGAVTAAGTILNDDPAPATQIGFTTSALSLAEGNGGATGFAYALTRGGDTSGASSVNWAVAGSGANPADAADFQGGVLPSGVVSFAAGETSKIITVNVAGDTTFEPDEGFTVTLSGATGATLGTATAAGTILNDDVAASQTLTGTSGANSLAGGAGADSLAGLAGADTLAGNDGADTLDGGAGNDRSDGGAGDDLFLIRGTEAQSDTLTGGLGSDTLKVDPAGGAVTLAGTANLTGFEVFDGQGQAVQGNSNANRLDFSGFTTVTGVASISGLGGADTLIGSSFNDLLDGGASADTLSGGAGADTLIGGAGADTLTGGTGADVFRYAAFTESTSTARDLITDFEGAGVAGGDVIDVSALTAIPFSFNGTGAFSGGGIPSIRYVIGSGVTDIQFDDGAGGAAEMVVRVNGVMNFAASDFIL